MSTCNHIVGKAFKLNPEEGPAWITPYIRLSEQDKIPEGDWTTKFAFCPEAGLYDEETGNTKKSRLVGYYTDDLEAGVMPLGDVEEISVGTI